MTTRKQPPARKPGSVTAASASGRRRPPTHRPEAPAASGSGRKRAPANRPRPSAAASPSGRTRNSNHQPESIPHRRWFVFAWVLVLLATGMLDLYLFPALQGFSLTAMAASFVPYAVVLWGLAGVVLFLSGRGWGRAWAAVALIGGLVHAQVLVPYTSRFPLAPGPQYTVATLNLHFGEADLEALAASPAAKASVLVLTETSESTMRDLDADPWVKEFPHRAGFPDGFVGGTVILSRTKLSEVGRTETRATGVNAAFRVSTPLGRIVVIGAHPKNPVEDAGVWLRDSRAVLDLAQSVGDKDPQLIIGDLNATLESATLQTLLANGFSDAAATAGSGWQPTFPADSPAIAIDHVLTSDGLTAASTQTFAVPGTDHLGLIATLQQT